MMDTQPFETLKTKAWDDTIRVIYEDDSCIVVLHHPDFDPQGRTAYVYMKHVPTKDGTANYDDVSKALDRIKGYMVDTLGIQRVIVIGDQQTFSRMVWLKRFQPKQYDWVVPFPGEFHFVVHLLMAIHILWYTQLVGYVLLHSGVSTESIVEKWDSVEKYNRHRFFYEALIVGALEYLKEVIPKELMGDPVALLQRAKRNKGPNHLHMHLIDGN